MIVLDELVCDPKLREHRPAVALVEEPALVPVDERFDQGRAVESGIESSHSGLP